VTLSADPFGWLKDQGDDAPLLLHTQSAFVPFRPLSVVGLAVSGGSDSMAMLHLVARVAHHAGWRVEAVTVDHRLRPEAADEAAFVARTCADLGVPHQVVAWDHDSIRGNLMDQARQARYRLIAEWAHARNIGLVALGHTADDQAETFVMGLARKAGLDGLAGIRATWRSGSVTWARPFLHRTRADMRGYLVRNGLPWRDDPTNGDDAFTRIKARRAMAALSPLGITAAGLARVADNLDDARRALTRNVGQEAARVASERAGAIELDHAAYAALPFEIQRRMLIAALRWISGANYPPRETGLNRVQMGIIRQKATTLSGCRIAVTEAHIRILREPRAANAAAPVGTLWDHRWIVEGPPGEVRALGPTGLPQVKNWRTLGIPRDALLVTPAVWDGDTLLAAPAAGMENGWKARIAVPFHRFPVSD
jgi:tRNA(Ile)-lysidine synthase